ncbi:MAG: SUMF1/EgtB/PvdO family nonheme iron enzyme [Ekhidna sp.]|nr:SUMF1/EgtB/PvdO family nonheme iron enzyme [Ekhidna sp.]
MSRFLLILLVLLISKIGVTQEVLNLGLAGQEVSFIKIPAGSFVMGSDSVNVNAQKDEFPQTKVQISRDFYLGQTEVTQELFELIMGYNPSVFNSPNNAVEMISWHDSQAFIDELNKVWKGEGSFRMPTEAEWEYACRMGEPEYRDEKGQITNWKLQKYAWFYSRSEGKSHPVASKEPDKMGFYDLQGGLWEWCNDWKGKYNGGEQVDPQGPEQGERKIYRGGSWFNEPEALRSENRNAHPPSERFPNAGLRLVYQLN